MRLLALVVLILGGLGLSSVMVTRANYSDVEESSNNTFEAGDVDLKIANSSYYNGVNSNETSWAISDLTDQLFFNFNDLKPGDFGENTVSFLIETNPSWLCAEMAVNSNDDLTCNEPELQDDVDCNEPNDDLFDGELAGLLNYVLWVDDGDNVMEQGESEIARGNFQEFIPGKKFSLADATENVFSQDGEPLVPNQTYAIGNAWCFGDMSITPVANDSNAGPDIRANFINCNGLSVNNASQTDLLKGDVSFNAIQARGNPNYRCTDCVVNEKNWATEIVNTTQGKRNNGTSVLPERSNPESMLGPAEDSIAEGTFYSLGFGGEVTLAFQHPVMDLPGNDLSFHEATNQPYPREKAKVFGSQDGENFTLPRVSHFHPTAS
jgi:predicted ribosomally synthesized peptide with SipW-like signal peptide